MSALFWNLIHDTLQEMRLYLRDGYETGVCEWSDTRDEFEVSVVDTCMGTAVDSFCFKRLSGESDSAVEQRFDDELPKFIEKWGY